jgi:hypothetical protein
MESGNQSYQERSSFSLWDWLSLSADQMIKKAAKTANERVLMRLLLIAAILTLVILLSSGLVRIGSIVALSMIMTYMAMAALGMLFAWNERVQIGLRKRDEKKPTEEERRKMEEKKRNVEEKC